MAAAVVHVIIDDLLQILWDGFELGTHLGVEPELRMIYDLLSSILGVLPEAEKKYRHSLGLQEWVRKLKHVAFDVEDLLEELFMGTSSVHLRVHKLRPLFRALGKIVFRQRMRGELRDVTRRLQGLIFDPITSFRNIVLADIGEVPEAAHAVPLIGRDEEKRTLLKRLLNGGDRERDIPVHVIHECPGSGKTAIVKEVCSEFEVRQHFDALIWVNASPPFDENRMACEIMSALTNGSRGLWEEQNMEWGQLLLRVTTRLDWKKRYLFVLDDLSVRDSETQRWLHFKSSLEGGASGSKILVTTRDSGGITSIGNPTLYLGGLTQRDSLDLLMKTASKGGQQEISDPEKLRIAEGISAQCDGNPLVLRAVAGYLSLQHATSDWSRFLYMLMGQSKHSVISALVYGGYPYGHSGAAVKRWNDLPPGIKQCLGISSLFPRGHVIDRQTLSELWLGHGYIKPSDEDDRLLEEIVDDYLDRLIGEELLQVKELDIFGKVRSVMQQTGAEDLARSVTRWEGGANRWSESWWTSREANVLHASVMRYSEFFTSPLAFNRLRTFLYFVDNSHEIESLYNHVLPRLKRTRVLDLHHMKVGVVPESVWNLKHLRYLNLSGSSNIKTLSPAITGLPYLQTLKLSGCSELKDLPRDMVKMVKLRHLYIDGCGKLTRMPMGLGNLKFLNILTDFILPIDESSAVYSAHLSDLRKLNNLRGSLRIKNFGHHEDEDIDNRMEELLDKKNSLESVELIFSNLRTDNSLLEKLQPHSNLKGLRIHNFGGTLFPEWMTRLSLHLPNLVEIALIGCENCEQLPQLSQLRHLKLLSIQGLPDLLHMESGLGQGQPYVVDNAQPFSKLSSLCVRDCPKLQSLPLFPCLVKLNLVNVGEKLFQHPYHLPKLRSLRLENIELIDHLPEDWLRNLTSLEELHIGSCRSLISLSRGLMHLEKLAAISIWDCKELDLSKDENGNIVMELQGLKSLMLLTIYKASKLECLPEWISNVATLRYLHIRSCPSLVELPEWIGNFESLKLLELIHCPRLTSLPRWKYKFTNGYPRKLNIVGCPLLKCEGTRHSRKL